MKVNNLKILNYFGVLFILSFLVIIDVFFFYQRFSIGLIDIIFLISIICFGIFESAFIFLGRKVENKNFSRTFFIYTIMSILSLLLARLGLLFFYSDLGIIVFLSLFSFYLFEALKATKLAKLNRILGKKICVISFLIVTSAVLTFSLIFSFFGILVYILAQIMKVGLLNEVCKRPNLFSADTKYICQPKLEKNLKTVVLYAGTGLVFSYVLSYLSLFISYLELVPFLISKVILFLGIFIFLWSIIFALRRLFHIFKVI